MRFPILKPFKPHFIPYVFSSIIVFSMYKLISLGFFPVIFRELTSTFVKLKSLVQRAKETLEENIIDLYKEITRLEKIENDAKILR